MGDSASGNRGNGDYFGRLDVGAGLHLVGFRLQQGLLLCSQVAKEKSCVSTERLKRICPFQASYFLEMELTSLLWLSDS